MSVGNFMERLNYLMQRDNIKTQYALAKQLGIRLNVVNNWFTGVVKCPRDNYLNKIASFFHVQPAWLRYGDKRYAPSYTDDVQRISERLEEYGKENPEKLRRKIKLFEMLLEEDQFPQKCYPVQKKAKGRKTA